MLALARPTSAAEIHEHVPEVRYHDGRGAPGRPRGAARGDPRGPGPDPAAGPRPAGAARPGQAVRHRGDDGLRRAIQAWGRVAGYRDEVWTNWYRKPLYAGHPHARLHARAARSRTTSGRTYPRGRQRRVPAAGPDAAGRRDALPHRRRLVEQPRRTRRRARPAPASRATSPTPPSGGPTDEERPVTPNPRLISRKLLTRGETMKEVPFLNLLAASWIQFQNGDWITHGEMLLRRGHRDPARPRTIPPGSASARTAMFIGRTQPDPTRREPGRADAGDLHQRGHPLVGRLADLRQRPGHPGPPAQRRRRQAPPHRRRHAPARRQAASRTPGWSATGGSGVAMLHTLFAREHNAICDHLKAAYPDWDDNRLFNVARLVNAAVMAKIHSDRVDAGDPPQPRPRPRAERQLVRHAHLQVPQAGAPQDRRRLQRRQPRARRPGRQPRSTSTASRSASPRSSWRSTACTRCCPRSSSSAATTPATAIEDAAVRGQPPGGLAEGHRATSAMADLLLLVRQPAPGPARAEQLPAVHAGAEHPRQPGVRHGRRRHPARPRARRAPLQRVPPPARPQPDPHLRRPHRRPGHGRHASPRSTATTSRTSTCSSARSPRARNAPPASASARRCSRSSSSTPAAGSRPTASTPTTTDPEVYSKEGMQWVDDASLKTVHPPPPPRAGAPPASATSRNAFEPWDTDAWLDPGRHPLRACQPGAEARPLARRRPPLRSDSSGEERPGLKILSSP